MSEESGDFTETELCGTAEERLQRRIRSSLYIAGIGVILFALWTILKDVMILTVSVESYRVEGIEDYTTAQKVLFYLSEAGAIIVEVFLRLLVGRGAMREAVGKNNGRRSSVYLILDVILLIFSLLVPFFTLMDFAESDVLSVWDVLVDISVELTSAAIMVEVLVASFRLRRTEKRIAAKEG